MRHRWQRAVNHPVEKPQQKTVNDGLLQRIYQKHKRDITMRNQLLLLLPILLLTGCKDNFWLEVDGKPTDFTAVQSGDPVTFNWDLNAINKAANGNIVAADITPLLGAVGVSGPTQPQVSFSNFYRFEGQTSQGGSYSTDPVEVVALHRYCGNDDVSLKLDLWVPNSPAPAQGYPAVVVMHGGGWRDGDYSDVYQFNHALSQAGFVAVSIQYRLSENGGSNGPTGVWPVHIQDAKCAVRWLRNQNLVNVDRTRIGAMGWSAGAHLALMLGVTDRSDDATATQLITGYRDTLQFTNTDDSVQAVASIAGPTDLLSTWEHLAVVKASGNLIDAVAASHAFTGVELLFPSNPPAESAENKNLLTQNSPLFFLDNDTAARVPFLILHGDEDRLVPLEEGCKFANALTTLGGQATVLRYSGANTSHFSYFQFRSPNSAIKMVPDYGKQSARTLQDVVSFFKANLQETPVTPQYSVAPWSCS